MARLNSHANFLTMACAAVVACLRREEEVEAEEWADDDKLPMEEVPEAERCKLEEEEENAIDVGNGSVTP